MERNDEAILTRIGEEFGNQIGELVARCIIKSVTIVDIDEQDNVALVRLYDGDEPLRVPLQLLNVGEAVIKVIPTKDTTALIVGIDGNINRPCFVSYSQVDEVYVRVGESTIQIADGKITFNGGDNNGLVLAQNLCDRLNTIENDINTLKNNIVSWVPKVQDGGASLKTQLATWAAQTLQQTKVSDVENDKIVQ